MQRRGFVRGIRGLREEGKASCVILCKSLNLSAPLAPYLAMPAASSHPSDLSSFVTTSERPSRTLNNQFGPGGVLALSVINYLWFILRLVPLGAGILPFPFTRAFPPLICHHPGISGKDSGLELWRPGFIIPTLPPRS